MALTCKIYETARYAANCYGCGWSSPDLATYNDADNAASDHENTAHGHVPS
jgi:hypothetical protein